MPIMLNTLYRLSCAMHRPIMLFGKQRDEGLYFETEDDELGYGTQGICRVWKKG